MKRFFTFLSLFFLFSHQAIAGYGYYGDCSTFVQIGTTYYKAGACTSNSNALDGATLGTNVTTLTLGNIQAFTFQNGGDNVMNGTFAYRVYQQGTTPGSFNNLNLSTLTVLGGGNVKRETTPNINLCTGLQGSKTYVFECYFYADVDWNVNNGVADATIYMSNSSANYKGTFITDPSLSSEIIMFDVDNRNKQNILFWQTVSEKNNTQFNIQRSTNNQSWQTIGTVKATNNPTGAKYNFTDDAPLSTVNYYRLQIVDRDGKMDYSKVVAVSGSGDKKSLSVYPNPVKAELNILTDGNTEGGTIYDMTGKIVRQFNDNRSKVIVSDLPNGVYFIRLLDKNGFTSEAIRFVKQ